jgi:chromosome segregation ATPase
MSKLAIEKLEALESRVRGLVDMVQELKRSNAALQTELRAARERLHKQDEQTKRWEEERDHIKSRVERVLGELEYLEAMEEPAAS